MILTKLILLIALSLFAWVKCAEDSNDQQEGNSVVLGQLSIALDDIESTVPQDMAIASVTSDQSLASIEVVQGQLQTGGLVQNNNSSDYLSKLEKLKNTTTTMNLEECADAIPEEFNLAQGNLGHATCFGPEITSNLLVTSIGSGDAGIWWDFADPLATSGQACSAEVVNNLMNNAGSYGESAIGLVAFAACTARINQQRLPSTEGESTDYSSSISTVDTASRNFSLTSAAITFEGLTSDGFPKFTTNLEGNLADVARGLEKSFSLSLTQIIKNDSYTEYDGIARFRIAAFEDNRDAAISLKYTYSSERGLNYRYRQVQVEGNASNVFDPETLEVADETYAQNWAEILVENDINGFGKLSFVWRTVTLLVFNVVTNTDGTGTAYFGHRDDTTELGSDNFYRIQGLSCLPQNPGLQFSDLVQKQTLVLDQNSGVWNLNESNTLFAPTATCNSGSGENYTGSNDGFTKSLNGPITHELESLSSYENDWVSPVIPAVSL